MEKHLLKKVLPVASSLDGFVNIEIEDAQGIDFFDRPGVVPHEKLFNSHLQDTNTLIHVEFHIQSMAIR